MLRVVPMIRAHPEATVANLKIGDRAPAFTLVDQHGDKVRLSSFKGRPVVVYFLSLIHI